MTECEHGDPRPERCALCRRREVARIAPWKLRPTTRHPEPQTLTERPVPRPIWYEAMVEDARRALEQEDNR